jgi:hypothetical protein
MIGAAAGNASSYVRPQIDHTLVDEGKHRAFGKDTGTGPKATNNSRMSSGAMTAHWGGSAG